MRRARTRLQLGAVAALCAALGIAACGGSAPAARSSAAAHPCRGGLDSSLTTAAVPQALVRALPVLGRTHTRADVLPGNSRPMATLNSLATGVEFDHAQLIGSSPLGGRAWVIPVLHDAPPVARTLACLQRQLKMRAKLTASGPAKQFQASLYARQANEEHALQRYVDAHRSPAGPGVLVYTTFHDIQGADATLTQLEQGAAFKTGECGGPGHNLLTVTGLAPAPTHTIELQAPDGTEQTQPVRNGAYSFLFAPSAKSQGLPDKVVLLAANGRVLHKQPIPASSFSTNPLCSLGRVGPHGPVAVLPAGVTVIASSEHGPYGVSYTIGASSAGGAKCDPDVEVQSSQESSGGGTPLCNVSAVSTSLTPTFNGGGCGHMLAEENGEVSTAVKEVRFVAANGQTVTAPVFPVPSNIATGYGVIFAIGPTRVLGADPKIESIGTGGRVLAIEQPSGLGMGLAGCLRHFTTPPATLLAPGIISEVSGQTPQHTPFVFSLQRIRYAGTDLLCPQQTPQGGSQCFPFHGPTATPGGNPPLSASPPVLLTPGGYGSCKPPRFDVVSGLVMRPHLTVWFKTPNGTRRIPLVRTNPLFEIPGGVFTTIITASPDTLIARNAAGKTVYTEPVIRPGAGFCGSFASSPGMTRAEDEQNITPRLITHPFG